MYKRLLDCKKSIYDKKKYIKDYRQSQSYKKLSCKYPCIDFYRPIKISNFISSLRTPNKEKIFINMKPKRNKQKKTLYQTLFFSKEINNENKKNKLFLDKIKLNIANQKKINEHIKMHYILKDYFEKKENILNATFSSFNEKNINEIKNLKTNGFKHNNIINIFRNSDNNCGINNNFKQNTSNNKNCNLIENENICLT